MSEDLKKEEACSRFLLFLLVLLFSMTTALVLFLMAMVIKQFN